MKKLLQKLLILAFLAIISSETSNAQCVSNIGFENGNFGGWSTATDSLFINSFPNRVYLNPGRNMGVINYGGVDAILGTIFRANPTVGNRLIKVGNRGVRAVSDTVYRSFVIDSLSDKISIYSYGVVELAHNYWGVPVVEAPGFGYEVYVNGVKVDCLKGAFFCGNTDQPPVWQLGTFTDSGGVRKSTGWGEEVLNFACFVGDTVEIRLFTRDCILLGHYAYAYFDVVCGDTTKPVISQISVNDIIDGDVLDLFCTQDATLELTPDTDICPYYMGNIQWTPAQYIIGSVTQDTALIHVPDSVWIYAQADFSNYCQTITIFDSIFVKYWAYDPRDNVPKIDKNYCDCISDTIDFSGLNVTTIWDDNSNTQNLNTSDQLIISPCDKFYEETFWKDESSQIVTNNSTIGTSSYSSGNSEGAISYDTMTGEGWVRIVVNNASGKDFFIGLNDVNSSNNNDMENAIRFNGGSISSYYNGSYLSNLGSFTGTVTIDFEILSNRRVRIWVNGNLEYTYSSGRRVTFPYFVDFSARSNFTNLVDKVYLLGPTKNAKDFSRLLNHNTLSYYMTYVDRCGITVNDTISYIPGFNAFTTTDIVQCGLDAVEFLMQGVNSYIDHISWTSNGTGSFYAPAGNGTLNSQNVGLDYIPAYGDYNQNPVEVIITASSGSCTDVDTAYLDVNEIPMADAGPDISTTLDTFQIGGSPAGTCNTCGSFNFDWTQGSALSDSITGNPDAYKSLILAPEFILTVTDPVSGCYAQDTTYIYTSLSQRYNNLEANCLSNNIVEINWMSIPTENITAFAVEFSEDGGRSWYQSGRMESYGPLGSVPSAYSMSIEKRQNPNTIYRWVSLDVYGNRVQVEMMDNLNCTDIPVYTIYPNPFTQDLELNIYSATGNKMNYTVEIFNQFGQIVYSKEVRLEESNISTLIVIDGLNDLSSGLYHFTIKNNGDSLYKTTIVKTN